MRRSTGWEIFFPALQALKGKPKAPALVLENRVPHFSLWRGFSWLSRAAAGSFQFTEESLRTGLVVMVLRGTWERCVLKQPRGALFVAFFPSARAGGGGGSKLALLPGGKRGGPTTRTAELKSSWKPSLFPFWMRKSKLRFSRILMEEPSQAVTGRLVIAPAKGWVGSISWTSTECF